MEIIFIYESNHPVDVKDGLAASLEVLGREFKINRINITNQDASFSKDAFVLGWGAFGGNVDKLCQTLPNKKGLCIAGNTHPPHGADNYDVLFYETKWYRPQIMFHDNIVQAFGYNSNLFKDLKMERDVDYLGVGALANWKRWEKMIQKQGYRRVVGEFQRGNPEESGEICDLLESNGVIYKEMMTGEQLVLEYNRAKTFYMPANIYGGGERTILEARACGCRVEIEPDNPKLQEVLEMPLWDHHDYAERLRRGICESL